LLVFDNADDLSILKNAWPGSGQGSVLATSRDFSASFSPVATGFHVQPFENTVEAIALLTLVDKDDTFSENQSLVKEITHILSELPLALNQIDEFIVQQRFALKNFLALYKKNAAKINARKSRLNDYEHSLSTV
jgi:predicted amino acid-binding ACT domain protein